TDIERLGMLHAKVLRSPHAHARIVSVDASAAKDLAGVTAVLTRDDVEDLKLWGTLVKDQPAVACDRVRYVGDIVAAVAAVDERTAFRALDLIDVRYEVLPAVFDFDDAMDERSPEIFSDAPLAIIPDYHAGASAAARVGHNISYQFSYHTGSGAVWDQCDHVFEDEFVFSRMNHMHLEPFVAVAEASPAAVELWSSTQSPFPLRRELSRIFSIPENRVRVHVPLLGGGFGAKNLPKADVVAIRLSQLSGGRPVRFAMTTEEVFLTISQHAARLTVRTGVMADGTFVARKSTVLLNGGAYSDLSPLVAEKAGYRMPGPYRWAHLDSTCKVVVTNTVPAGAFRGFGGAQANWASERQVDMIAERLGMAPLELRFQNIKRLGEEYVPGETSLDSDLAEGLRIVAAEIGYTDRDRRGNRGMGISVGAKDGGGVNKPAQARVKISTNGDVFLSSGLTEMGQGGHSALCQIVAEVLKCPRERVG
ncbi:MAG: xanthine dehydrogenase family protein molybdopterin-binding subunit, partial [Comamonadaceae bacterium]